MIHPAQLPIEQLLEQCDARRQRRSGPGGQHRNKVETAVVLVHRDSGCQGEASERRSQEANRQQAIQRLRVELALAIREPLGATASRDAATLPPPTPRWQRRLQAGKLKVNAEHEDFPALLAEALDTLQHFAWDVSPAAQRLGCSNTQLLKLLKLEHRAFLQLNAARQALGLGKLR